MKNGKRPTKKEKMLMNDYGLNPTSWLIYKKVEDELHLVHLNTNKTRVIPNS